MRFAHLRLVPAVAGLAVFVAAAVSACNGTEITPPTIDGDLALRYAQENYDLGPKVYRTEGAKKSAEWIVEQAKKTPGLEKAGGTVRIPPSSYGEYNVEIAFPGPSDDFVVVGAHHDTKLLFSTPEFAGANDGASGVGALLAMAAATAEYAQRQSLPVGIRFVFFDGEEALYQYTKTDGLVGSRAYVNMLRQDGSMKRCRAMILLDMIGDRDLHIELAGNSTAGLAGLVLKEAEKLGHADKFSRGKTPMIDDHYPFLQAGIPAVDLIDFNYGPENCYWHTGADTMDKLSAESIKCAADVALRTVWRIAASGFKDQPK